MSAFDRAKRTRGPSGLHADDDGSRSRVRAAEVPDDRVGKRANANLDEDMGRARFAQRPERIVDILVRIAGDLPKIAREAGVDIIVSVWSLSFREPSAQFVDVTDRLLARFDPDEKTREIVRDLRGKPPLSAEELAKRRE
jgi:hypothetical protein